MALFINGTEILPKNAVGGGAGLVVGGVSIENLMIGGLPVWSSDAVLAVYSFSAASPGNGSIPAHPRCRHILYWMVGGGGAGGGTNAGSIFGAGGGGGGSSGQYIEAVAVQVAGGAATYALGAAGIPNTGAGGGGGGDTTLIVASAGSVEAHGGYGGFSSQPNIGGHPVGGDGGGVGTTGSGRGAIFDQGRIAEHGIAAGGYYGAGGGGGTIDSSSPIAPGGNGANGGAGGALSGGGGGGGDGGGDGGTAGVDGIQGNEPGAGGGGAGGYVSVDEPRTGGAGAAGAIIYMQLANPLSENSMPIFNNFKAVS